MELATAHTLTALYALSHRIALTPDEIAHLDGRGVALTPQVWRETKAMLKAFDQSPEPATLDLGFQRFVYQWLGVAHDEAFRERYGVSAVEEAFAKNRGLTAVLAGVVDGSPGRPQEFYQLPLVHAWSDRATRLMDGLPESGSLVIATLERAIDLCAGHPRRLRPLCEAIVHVADLIGDEPRGGAARTMLETIERETSSASSRRVAATQLLTALWLLTHEGDLLASERLSEPDIHATPATWDKVARALHDGRIDDIPVPVRFVRTWGAPEELTDDVARGLLSEARAVLPQVVAELERVWGGGLRMDVDEEVARAVASIALLRLAQLQCRFEPVPGEKESIWFEVHQGVRRPETMEHAAVLRRLRAVVLRCEVDPFAVAMAYVDSAQEHHARGAHDQTRADLAEAMRWSAQVEGDEERRQRGAVCLAQWLWLDGSPEEARRRLSALGGERAASLLRNLETRDDARAVLHQAEEEFRQRGDVESWCGVAVAHLLSGQNVRAELVAREVSEKRPESGLSWHTLASVLVDLGRYRDAIEPARKALELAPDPTPNRASLARILSRIGSEGREEGVQLALSAIEGAKPGGPLSSEVLAELADIAHYGGVVDAARRADDLVSERRDGDAPPPEWLGAAVARRCHRLWTEDAPLWLARLAEAGSEARADLACFVVERVEVLAWWETLIDRTVLPAFDRARKDRHLPSITAEQLREAARIRARKRAVGGALRAAVELGYAESDPDDDYEPSDSEAATAVTWQALFAQIVSFCGDEPAIRLRASQVAQSLLFGPQETGEDELLVIQATFSDERLAWIRYMGESRCSIALANQSGLSPVTRSRLDPLFALAQVEDDEEIRGARWVTRWHKNERWER